MLSLENVTKVYPLGREAGVAAVRDTSLRIERGEFVIITGRSGSGKTTLLNLLAGLTRPTAGRVVWEGVDLWRLSDRRRSILRHDKIGFVFQFPSLMPSLTVDENVLLPAMFGKNGAGPAAGSRASELLATMGLDDKRGVLPRQLSAGQQQRVVIARALLNRPQVLLADEPTSDLDEQTEAEIMDLFRRIHAETAITICLVTHSTELVGYGTRSVRMAEGRVVDATARGLA